MCVFGMCESCVCRLWTSCPPSPHRPNPTCPYDAHLQPAPRHFDLVDVPHPRLQVLVVADAPPAALRGSGGWGEGLGLQGFGRVNALRADAKHPVALDPP